MTQSSTAVRQAARREVADFLASRRARVSPEDAGLPRGSRRRVPGLRRQEVALLAGISVDYYARLERGLVGAVGEPVLTSLASVLRLDPVELEHLRSLVRAASGEEPSTHPAGDPEVTRGLQELVDGIRHAAVFVRNARLDVLVHNGAFAALYDQCLEAPGEGNILRYLFLDSRSRAFYRNWDRLARGAVGSLRADRAHTAAEQRTTDLLRELGAASDDFVGFWEGHAVESYASGVQEFRHHLVGDLDLAYETFQVAGAEGLTMIAYHPLSGSASEAPFAALVTSGGGR